MEIRSITLFAHPLATDPARLAPFAAAARSAFPYPVQTLRLAAPPFPDWWPPGGNLAQQAQAIASRWQAIGIDYVSLGPVLLRHDPDWLEMIPALLGVTDVLFATAEIAGDGQIDTGRCRRCAELIKRISRVKEDGFGNLYFAALANCGPGAPFFPVAYHGGADVRFAVAVEGADVALQAMRGSRDLPQARAQLVAQIETAASTITQTAETLAAAHGIPFAGIDFSPAPFPDDEKSLGGALEALGAPHVGASGSLFAAAFITEAIDRARFARCGFSGLMLPVLEDTVLARRAARGQLTLQDLLSYAAVCGTGLDTIPLPGDASVAQLTAVLLDVAALALRLHKPLTARLMPLPQRAAGDTVQFDFPYFAASRVMSIAGAGVRGPLAQPARLPLHSIEKRET